MIIVSSILSKDSVNEYEYFYPKKIDHRQKKNEHHSDYTIAPTLYSISKSIVLALFFVDHKKN